MAGGGGGAAAAAIVTCRAMLLNMWRPSVSAVPLFDLMLRECISFCLSAEWEAASVDSYSCPAHDGMQPFWHATTFCGHSWRWQRTVSQLHVALSPCPAVLCGNLITSLNLLPRLQSPGRREGFHFFSAFWLNMIS